jgi:hypothetical protein
LRFYTEKLGFRILTDQEFLETQRWIELSIPGAETGVVLFTPEGQEDRIGTPVNTSWQVDRIDRTYEGGAEESNSPGRRRSSPGGLTPS